MTNQELKDILSYGFAVGKLLDTAVHGISFSEIPDVITLVQGAQKTASEAKQALSEYLTLDAPGRADIDSYIATNCVLPDAGAQAAAQAILTLIVDAEQVVGLFKKG